MEFSPWRTLSTSSESSSLPTLLAKYSFSTRIGYGIYLTDLTNIWSERLSRSDIVQRASVAETSVDPSMGLDQYEIFLSRIESALSGAPDSSLRLSRGQQQGNLNLQISSKLPEPLPTLQFTIELDLAPPRELTAQLVSPLLVEYNHQVEQTGFLIERLKEKDHIISKLIDKLTIMGLDLGTIFPSAAGIKLGKNQTLREAAGKHVLGLGEFLRSDIKHDIEDKPSEKPGSKSRISLLEDQYMSLGGEQLEHKSDWWEGLSTKTWVDLKKPALSLQDNHSQYHNAPSLARETRDYSQVHENVLTPNPASEAKDNTQSTNTKSTTNLGNVSTDDETSSSLRLRHFQDESQSVDGLGSLEPHQILSKKIGTIGGFKKKKQSIEPSQQQHSTDDMTNFKANHSNETDRESTVDAVKVEEILSSPIKRGLRRGVIGGNRDNSKSRDLALRGSNIQVPNSSSGAKNLTLAGMNMRPTTETQSGLQDSEEEMPSHVSESRSRESSIERADRRREKLKKELEGKKKAPAKKRRRF